MDWPIAFRGLRHKGMTDAQDLWFDTAVSKLSDPQNQRVWSVIVSLFGDLAQQKGASINGQTLTQIITPMGIKPEAIRVALHRLRKDGWIDSTRSGRASVHFLTESGRSQSAAVTPRIYAREIAPPTEWHLAIAEDGQSAILDGLLEQADYVSVNRCTALGLGKAASVARDLLVVHNPDLAVPEWLQRRLFPEDLRVTCSDLDVTLAELNSARSGLAIDEQLSAAQIATLRTLIVHRWRRVVLRHPDLPLSLHPDDWRGEPCRRRVAELLEALPRPTLAANGDLAGTAD